MLESVIFAGVKIALEQLYKKLRSKNKYLVIIANRESIASDAEAFFKGHKVLYKIINPKFSLEQNDIEKLVEQIEVTINSNTSPGDTVIFILAAPCIIYAFLADRFHHSSRHILFAQFDLSEKTYRLYKISSH